jgi:4-hydroxybenzoate polyprenyltransferase
MSAQRDYARLVRLPNVFTAAADVLAGYWLISPQFGVTPSLGLTVAASMSFYAGGIVLNDYVDYDEDRAERPDRPLPAGRISLVTANRLYRVLLAVGLMLSVLAARLEPDAATTGHSTAYLFVPVALVLLILGYNILLKRTALAAVAMGGCRALNLMLGMMLTGAWTFDGRAAAVAALFLYVTALSHFGRRETTGGTRMRLMTGSAGMGASLLLLGAVAAERMIQETATFVLWLALCIHLGRVALRAIRAPSPAAVQYAMKTFILGIIAFDAVLASAAHGWPAGLFVLTLLVPTLIVSRWSYST